MNLKTKLEKFAVLGTIAAVLWTARLAFIGLIGDHWFGTLGITSILFGSLTYLSWNGRLGKFGHIYKEIIQHKLAKKLTKVRLGLGVLTLFFFTIFSAGMHASSAFYEAETEQLIHDIEQANPDIMDESKAVEMATEQFNENPASMIIGVLSALVLIPTLVVVNFPMFASIMGSINQVFSGQLIHVVDIVLVEELEILGILFFVSWIQRKPKTLTRN